MKKLFCLLLSVLLMFAITGCNSEREDEEEDGKKNTYKTAIQDQFEIMIGKGTRPQYWSQYPKEYWDWYEDKYEKSFDDAWEEYEDNKDDTLDYWEDEYGKNFKVTIKWEDEDAWKDKYVKILAEYLNNIYGIDEDSVETVYEVDGEVTIKGEEDEDDDDFTYEVVKIGGKWYLLSYLTGGMDVYDMNQANKYYKENPDKMQEGPYGDYGSYDGYYEETYEEYVEDYYGY